MSTAGERLPYPGLRSFTREETDIFFGREGCVDDMVDRLAATRFLAVLGASGSGKSSLVKTGLLDALEIGLLHHAGSRWLIAEFRPGDRPIYNLAEGLLRASSANPTELPPEEEIKLFRAFLARGPRSVVEWCSENLPDGTNLLLLVDQFEELFRYSAYAEREEAEAFVSLLLESARAPLGEARIYVAITMRSEFLGAAALIDGLAEAINKGLYLTPRMSRDQVKDAIAGPAAVCGFELEPALVNRLLNDLTSFAPWEDDTGHQLERLVRRADQLPLMQHVLNRLWSIAATRPHSGPVVLKLADYEALGGLRGALAAHGREILDELLPEHREIAGAVFRALTAGSSLAEAVRRPTEFGELVEISGGDEIAVREIVEAFRAPGRNFLVPPRPAALRPDTLIDISHESLIRQWDEFAHWLQREITSADTWRRLVDAAERYKRGEANLISGLTLASIANWWDTERPTAAWAKRYGGDFDGAAGFLAESRRTEAAAKEKETEERRQKSRNRLVTWAAIIILCVITPLTVFAGYSAIRANQEAAAAEVAREDARRAAEAERASAEESRRLAEEQRLAAEAARQAELKAAEAQQRAEAEAARADEERTRALAAQQDAMQQAAAAEVERKRADEERTRAIAAQRDAMQQAAAAEAERQRADEERQRALVAQQEAVQQAAAADAARAAAEAARKLAEAETARADQERERAERARAEFQRANLQQLAGRVALLQQEGSWDKASNLLGALWQDLIGPDDERRQDWLIDPIVTAFARQNLAEFPIFPDFLNYSGLTGWTGTSGRFRVYALDRKAEDGSAITGNKIIVTFDAVTGATLGSFELPTGQDLGSKADLVSPDGSRVAIVTDKPEIALWAIGQSAPTLIPVPELGGEVGVSQLAPVHTDQRFALYLTVDETPNEFIVVDPATQSISFTVTTAEIMEKLGLANVDDVKLLGFVDDRLIMLVNKSDGQVVTVDARDGAIGVLETGAGVTGAELTQDGAFLLTLTCPGSCIEQHLTAFDLNLNAPLWVERVPIGMALSEEAISEIVVDGKPTYSVLVEQEGSGVVFQFAKDQPDIAERFDGGSHARISTISFDAKGGFRTVESASEESSADGLSATGILAGYRIPISRQKLSLYVAPNSVAVYQSGDVLRIAGVSYDGDLLVYRQRADGDFEDDVAFRPIPIAESNCLNSVGFGGDGKSLLFRHIDGSLLYVAAVGQGTNTDWRKPLDAVTGQDSVGLSESSPAFTCDRPEAAENEVEEKVVAVDQEGDKFALLDKTGSAWWVDVVDGADEAAMRAIREVAPLRRASSGIVWIAGDPARGRAALVTRSAVEILPQGGTVAEDVKEVRGGAAADQATVAEARSEAAAAAATPDPNRSHKLTRWGDPKAAAFGPEGEVVVAYGGGQITGFGQGADGVFAASFDGTFSLARIVGLFASKERIAAADDRDVVVALDSSDGALAGDARVPANPSLFALRSDGSILSVEYDTDSVAVVGFGEPVSAAGVADAARLATMRSLLDEETDASLDSLVLDHEMEQSLAAAAGPQSTDCAAEARQRLLRLETRLLGLSTGAATALSTDCSAADGDASLDAAETLARRMPGASVRELVEDDALSRLLQAAASGDATATRLLGAVLARIATERGELDTTAIAEETLRFGANLPATILKSIAAGAPISRTLLDLASKRSGPDPAAHQLIAHASERRINDVDSLTEALREFSIAERLYRAGGRTDEARFAAHRRAQLSRLLPDDRVLGVADVVEKWALEMPDVGPETALADLPAEPSVRRNFNMENANKLAERVPDSLLLDALRTEMERARIVDLRTDDPKAAADLLIDLGRRSNAASGWSPDLVREYLDLAEEIREGSAAPSALRLAAEAMRMIGAAFRTPIHDNAEASGLFRRAADLVAATVASAPRNEVAAALKDIDLSLLSYSYGVLPGADATEASQTGQDILQATARMAETVAGHADDPRAWNLLRGVSLFWQGVLVNDHDTPSAVPVLKASVEVLRPAVEADPQNVEARFRLAEALRWVGLADDSSEETSAVEREAVGEYQTIWKDRVTLDPGFAGDVGVGYGFALANLAQTMRETNLADFSDGKTAEDHAGWVLEILALAAEKDDVNATMVETGVATGDSTFVDGWYRMSSYGWGIGFLSGLVNVESGAGPVMPCDIAAADPYDPLRRAPGVETVSGEAESLCRAESDGNPDDARALFQLARAISADSSRESEYVSTARIAAEAGVSPAFSLVASSMSGDEEDHSAEAYLAASQHTIIESFPVLYPYLVSRATTERERQGLAWYARKAAALGVLEAHVSIADLSTDPLERLFRLELAARLADDAGDGATASSLREKAGAIPARKTDQERIEGDVSSWTPEPLVELPASSDSS